MKTVWKFPLGVADSQVILLPKGAKILSVAVQMNIPCIWAMVDSSETQKESRTILMRGTGHPANGAENAKFLGTVILYNGQIVFHIFDADGAE